jgi:hypothetical protein
MKVLAQSNYIPAPKLLEEILFKVSKGTIIKEESVGFIQCLFLALN